MSVFSSLLSPDENKNRGKNEKLLFKCLGLRNVLGRPDLEECLAGCESDNF